MIRTPAKPFWSWYLGETPLPQRWEKTGRYDHLARDAAGRVVAEITLNTNPFSHDTYNLYVGGGYVASFATVTDAKRHFKEGPRD